MSAFRKIGFFVVMTMQGVAGAASGEDDSVAATQSPSQRKTNDAWNLENHDRLFLLSSQADTMLPLTFRVGTLDQVQGVDAGHSAGWGSNSGFSGYAVGFFADFAATSWLQVGLTMSYGSLGDPATINLAAPAAYVKAQFLRQDRHGINMALAVNVKKIGFSRPSDQYPNAGEFESQLLADRHWGNFVATINGVFGKSFTAPDSDVELKVSAGYHLLRNLFLGLDSLTRGDTSFDGGPRDGTRYIEFTGGGVVTWQVWRLSLSALGGLAAPMHTPLGTSGLGPTAMLQVTYTPW